MLKSNSIKDIINSILAFDTVLCTYIRGKMKELYVFFFTVGSQITYIYFVWVISPNYRAVEHIQTVRTVEQRTLVFNRSTSIGVVQTHKNVLSFIVRSNLADADVYQLFLIV